MKKRINYKDMKSIFYLMTLLFLQGYLWAQETSSPVNEDPVQVKINAVKEELDLENVNIQSMGNNDQLMLEGKISDAEILKKSEEIAGQYFSNIYNLLSVDKNNFSYQLKLLEYSLSGNESESVWDHVLKEVAPLGSPSAILLFDQNEMEAFLKTITENCKGSPFPVKFSTLSNTSEYQGVFNDSSGQPYTILLQGFNLDNGFFKCKLDFKKNLADSSSPVYSKDIYCRNGEWIAVFGFQKLLYGQASNEADKKDMLILIQIQILPESV